MSPNIAILCTAIATVLIASAWAHAADVTVQPAAGSGFVVKGANESLRVQESGAVSLPGVPGAAAQSDKTLCMSNAGLLGPCSGGGGSGASYTAGTGLTLTGTAFAVAPTYQLPQTCTANQIPQWSGAAWGCVALPGGGATLPAGTTNQTLRYDAGNALVANSGLQAFLDGSLLASTNFTPGPIPATGQGTRMMWYKGKAAFRAGFVSSDQWDDSNIGSNSVAMGFNTRAMAFASTALGNGTIASGINSTALGSSTAASNDQAFAAGANSTASGKMSLALGESVVADSPNSFAIGAHVHADDTGCGIIGWGFEPVSGCYRPYELLVSAQNGLEVRSKNPDTAGTPGAMGDWIIIGAKNAIAGQAIATSTGAWLSSSGTWNNASDRNKKENFAPVDAQGMLDKVVHLPLTTWSYKTDHGKYRHLGPMAQDFYASFGLGQDDVSISTIDPSGVALAAIQGLNAKFEETIAAKDAEIAAMQSRIASLESANRDLVEIKRQLAALRKNSASITTVALQP